MSVLIELVSFISQDNSTFVYRLVTDYLSVPIAFLLNRIKLKVKKYVLGGLIT